MSAGIILHLMVLLFGSILISVMYENIARRETFSLPFSNVLIITLVGTALAVWWSWTSTLSTLTVYAVYSIVAGLYERSP